MNVAATRQKNIELLQLTNELTRRQTYHKCRYFKPYPKQLEFMSNHSRQRGMGAANQVGKTTCGAYEVAYHATGQYPDWWKGRKFPKQTVGWVCGVTGDIVRDSTQKLLIGRVQEGSSAIGTGSIPQDCIIPESHGGLKAARGTPDLLDHVKVRHVSGGVSLIYFKSYASGREKFSAETLDYVWLDEEPPMEIYSEALTRTNNGQLGQFLMLTYTPYLGMTDVSLMFYENPTADQVLIMMALEDAEHYSPEEREKIEASYKEWEREARVYGTPMLGSGRVFQFSEKEISEAHMSNPPDNWWYLNGLDFGYDHPQACIQLAWDKDNDVIHVLRARAERKMKATDMFQAVKVWADGIPTAWPHDGYQHDPGGSGAQTAQTYREAGFTMLPEHATHDKGGNGLQAGIDEMQARFGEGRLKIAATLDCFWREYRLFHMKDGKYVKINEDVIAAVRYALMMKRFAKQKIQAAPRVFKFVSDMPGGRHG